MVRDLTVVRRGWGRALVTAALLAGGIGCGSDNSGPAPFQPSDVYAELAFNHRAVTLALVDPFDTLQLTAHVVNGVGDTVPSSAQVNYSSLDTTLVNVDPSTGLLTARGATTGTPIVARLTIGNVTHTDTAIVAVTNDPHPSRLASFSIQPLPPDSTKMDIGSFASQTVLALDRVMVDSAGLVLKDSAGQSQTTYPISYRSSDPRAVLLLDARSGIVGTVAHPGQAWIHATTTVYGVTLHDSVQVIVQWPHSGQIQFLQSHSGVAYINPATDTLAAGSSGAILQFVNLSGKTVDLVFDDSTAVFPVNAGEDTATVGNIRVWSTADLPTFTDLFRIRIIFTPGTYNYHSTVVPSIRGKFIILP